MSDQVAEFQSPDSHSLNPVPEKLVIPEHKARLVTEAMDRFNEVTDGINYLKRADIDFIQHTDNATNLVARLSEDGRPSEAGYNAVRLAAEDLRASILPRLNDIYQTSQSLGGNLMMQGQELHEILGKAAAESDPIKAYAIAEQAVNAFNNLTQQVETQRVEQLNGREQLRIPIENNAFGAQRLLNKIAEQVGKELDESSIVYQYAARSSYLEGTIDKALADLSPREREILTQNLDSRDRFTKIVKAIIKPEDSPSSSAIGTSPN